jgi:hypothetical protein
LILKRAYGLATSSALLKAWEKKSKKWLTLAGALVLFQFWDSRAGRKATGKKAAK